jgi:protein-tyrosine phosphatase
MATKFGLDLEGHLSKGWEACEFEDADLILPMEFWQYRKLVEFFPHKKLNIRLLRDFSPFPENLLCNINDPFGQSEEIFEKCFRQIKRAIQALNARI